MDDARRARWRPKLVAGGAGLLIAAVLGGFGSFTAGTRSAPPVHNGQLVDGFSSSRTVDLAVGASASATSSANGEPPSNAVDGDASTAWCTNSWPDTLTVDLGSVRSLDGAGITLDSASSSASASLSLATSPGSFQPVASAQNLALDAGSPLYVPLGDGTSARYAQLTLYDSGSGPVCVGEFRLFGLDPAASQMMLGGDMSFTAQELAAGAHFSEDGFVANPIDLMALNGANWTRLRLWVNPPAGYSDLADDLAMARVVKAAHMKLYLDIHYSDFWADPGKQCIPAGWPTDLPDLAAKVESYTEQVLRAFAAQGTPVDMVSIGNEVTNGMLWAPSSSPPGPSFGCTGPGVGGLTWTSNTTATGWSNFATLLKAGIAGADAANPPGHQLLVMIHSDLGGNNAKAQAFYSNLAAQGVPFNVIGLSYYPQYQGSLTAMRENVDELATQFHLPIVLAETQYPWTLANGDALGNNVWQPSQLIDGYPASPGGQLSFVNDELSILAAVPDGLGAGLFYWAPEWIPGVSWAPGASPPGTPSDNLTLFDFAGRALPSIAIFRDPVLTCEKLDPFEVPCALAS